MKPQCELPPLKEVSASSLSSPDSVNRNINYDC